MGTERNSLSDLTHGCFQPIRPKSPLVLPHPKTGSVQILHACLYSVHVMLNLDNPQETRLAVINIDGKEILVWDYQSPHLTNAIQLACKWLIEHA